VSAIANVLMLKSPTPIFGVRKLVLLERNMISNETRAVIDRAKEIYERYRDILEAEHRDQFVAIEPLSGDYFVADSVDAAVRTARSAHPSRLSHTIWIGHEAVFHIGLIEQ
jgi:hypothetical protein